MRLKKRFGVYSNSTIKKGDREIFCNVCKGLCKNNTKFRTDPKTNWHLKNPINGKCIQHFGHGSLLPGKKFIFSLRAYSPEDLEPRSNYRKARGQNVKSLLKESIDEYNQYYSLNPAYIKDFIK